MRRSVTDACGSSSSVHGADCSVESLQLLGAHRSGIRTVVLPFGNRNDVYGHNAGVPLRVKEDLDIVWVRSMVDVLQAVFPDATPPLTREGGRVGRLQVCRL